MKQGFRHYFQVIVTISGMTFWGGVHHAVAQDGATCPVRDKSATVAIVVCPPGLGQEQWRRAGEAACANTKPCSAWIWDDPAKAPEKAPPLPTGVAKNDVLNSVAVWDNDTKQLLTISKVK